MLKKLLEHKIGQSISSSEFATVMSMATEDIKFNNIGFSKKTKRDDVLNIAIRCAITLKRCS